MKFGQVFYRFSTSFIQALYRLFFNRALRFLLLKAGVRLEALRASTEQKMPGVIILPVAFLFKPFLWWGVLIIVGVVGMLWIFNIWHYKNMGL